MTEAEALWIITSATSEDDLLHQFAEELKAANDADGCDIFLAEASGALTLRASTFSPEYVSRCRLGKGVGLCGQVFTTGEPIYLTKNANKHPQNVSYPGIDDMAYQAQVVAPLTAGDRRIGVLLLFKLTPWKLTKTLQSRIQKAAVSVAGAYAAYQNAYRHGAHTDTIGAVSEVSKTIGASPYVEEILQLLVNLTAQQFGYAVCTVRLLDERRKELVLRATQAPAKAYQRKPAIKMGQSIAGRAIDLNRPIIIPDVSLEPSYIGHDLAAEQGLRSMICVPLTVQDRPVGVMSCYTTDPHDFTLEEISGLETIAKQAAFSIEHAKLQVRSTLMQEMHHRVKNNLQQVASLLRLQMRHGEYKTLEEAMNDSLARILAISAVHDLLSREDLDHVGMRSLAESLVQILRDSMLLPDRRIKFEVRGDDVHLNTTQGTQIALVLNELIQNAVEHGFKETVEGEIHITVEDSDGDIGLWVSNSGDALPYGFDVSKSSSLGLKIVDNLAKSLGGKFLIEDRLGWTVAEVKFTRATSE